MERSPRAEADEAPQPLTAALEAFARRTGYQLVYRAELTEGRVSHGADVQNLAPAEALTLLLRDSGLGFEFINDRAIAIVKIAEVKSASPRSASAAGSSEPGGRLPGGDSECNVGGRAQMNNRSLLAGLFSVFGLTTAAGTACAQSAPAGAQTAPAPSQPSDALDEVVVTAARNAQNLQKVSQSVQLVSGDAIAEQGMSNVNQVLGSIPSVQATAQPGGFSVDIRGMGGDLPAGTTQGSVAVEFDGIYNINSIGTAVGMFDIDRVEVLPGPQSTRYGPDADGGVVNFISKDPVLGSWNGNAGLTIGNYNLVRLEAAQNIPVTDSLALRVAGAAIYRGSYFSDPEQGNDVAQSFRVKLLYKPSDDFTLKLGYQLDHVGGTGNGSNEDLPISSTRVPEYSGDSINKKSNPWSGDDVSSNGVSSASDQSHIYQNTVTGSFSWKLTDWAVLDELASYTGVHGSNYDCMIAWPPTSTNFAGPWTTGGNYSCYTIQEFSPFHQYSSETRLHSAPGAAITWNIGFYHWNYDWSTYSTDVGPFQNFTYATTTDAVFGEATYPITDTLRVIAGLRQSFDRRMENFGPENGVATPNFTKNLSHFDYRGGLEYDVTPSSMGYFTVSTGYRPGGISSIGVASNGSFYDYTFNNEVNTAFEIGSKNRFFDNRLQVNASAFYYIQDNFQNLDRYNGFDITAGGETVTCTSQNAPTIPACTTQLLGQQAHTLGLESQILFNLTPNDRIGDSFTYLDATFDKSQKNCATAGVTAAQAGMVCPDGYNDLDGSLKFFDIAGAVQPHSPKFSNTFTYRHTLDLASGATIALGGELFYSSGYFVNPVETDWTWQPAYYTASVDASYMAASGNWSVSAYARNLTNYAVKLSALPVATIGDPRTFGATLKYNW